MARSGERTTILCDDRNIVRRWPRGYAGGPPGFYVHGTWSHGDVPDVSSAGAPLRAILFLEQSPTNEIVPLTDRKEVWKRLLATLIRPLVTAEWWEKELDVLQQHRGRGALLHDALRQERRRSCPSWRSWPRLTGDAGRRCRPGKTTATAAPSVCEARERSP